MKTRNVITLILLFAVFLSACKKDASQNPGTGGQNNLAVSKSLNSLTLSHFKKKLSRGLVAWYPFLGNANDMSGNGNNGVLNNYLDPGTGIAGNLPVLTTDKCGHPDDAYSFDGSGGFISTKSFFTDSVSEFSIYVRFKSGSSGVLLGAGDYYMEQAALSLSVSPDNSIYFNWHDLFFVPEDEIISSSVSSGPLTVKPDAWVDVVINFKNSVLTVYMDGKKTASANAAFPKANFGGGGYIGADWVRYPSDFLTGTIDEVRVYDKPLSVEEIVDLYHHNKRDEHRRW